MLRKENLLIVPFVSGWREVTVGKSFLDDYYGYSQHYYHGNNIGNISDNLIGDKVINYLMSWVNGGNVSGNRTGTHVCFDSWYWPELYLQREAGNIFTLHQAEDEFGNHTYQINGNNPEYAVFTKDDMNKTINIYLGITPPP